MELHEMRRCKCPDLKWKLELLRTATPDVKQLGAILKGHKAPKREHRRAERLQAEPPEDEIAWVFEETPHTQFVAISRSAVAWINDIAVRHFFRGHMPLTVVPGDPEANPSNFHGKKQVANMPMDVPVFVGMRVMLTRKPAGMHMQLQSLGKRLQPWYFWLHL